MGLGDRLQQPHVKAKALARLGYEAGGCDRGRGVAVQMAAAAQPRPDRRHGLLERGQERPLVAHVLEEAQLPAAAQHAVERSEERRVGKEWRSVWSAD